MTQRTVYCLRVFRSSESGLQPTTTQQFRSETEARHVGEGLLAHVAGVVVFSQHVDPEFGALDDPEFIAAMGEVPERIR